MQGLNPALDQVGMMVFPGLSQAGVTANTTCTGSGKNKKCTDTPTPTPTPDKLCQRAIVSARKAAAEVYSVAYGAKKSGGCQYDTEGLQDVSLAKLSPCDTMRAISLGIVRSDEMFWNTVIRLAQQHRLTLGLPAFPSMA